MRVIKFGGTSLSAKEPLSNALCVIEEAAGEGPVVVVTSALAGITDLLVDLVGTEGRALKARLEAAEEEVRDRHLDLHASLSPVQGRLHRELQALLEELRAHTPLRRGGDSWTQEKRAHVLSLGDRWASLLVTDLLQESGHDARAIPGGDVVRTDSRFGRAGVDRPGTRHLARWTLGRLPRGVIPVVAGFGGADPEGRCTTLGRGSSDLTAALIGEALTAERVEIWSDVNGVFDQDPRQDPNARPLPRLTYREARALARDGAKVLHPECLDPLEDLGIPLQVRNTFQPHAAGTIIGPPAERTVRLILAGATGGVGRAFLRQLKDVAPELRAQGVEVKVSGAFSSRACLWSREGLGLDEVDGDHLGGSRPDWPSLTRRLTESPPENPLFVDCTASRDVAGRYPDILLAGAPVVTPNKLAWSGSLEEYRRVQEAADQWDLPCRYETTVGAALPILKTIRELKKGGDRFRTITGVLSGTLSFLFARLAEGVPFSEAVGEARDAGYTEPHPREDLTGADVARKLLILLRETGLAIEPDAISVESLVPDSLRNEEDPERFLAGLAAHDAAWKQRLAQAKGGRVAYVASFDGTRARVGVQTLAEGHPLADLRPTENMVVLETDRYPDVPLTIAGPGAGWEVTAAGVLSDFLSALHERYGSRRVA
jgi:aspartokinase/homoserine dehydrogenase 1